MKKLKFILLLFSSVVVIAQSQRTDVQGNIIVEGDDIEGITIYNLSSQKGTVSDVFGNFTIQAKVNDTVQVRALQYQNFDVVINENIVKSQRLKIYLIEQINLLDEIVINESNLSGELNTDLKSVKTFTPKMDAIYFGVARERELNESPNDFLGDDKTIANLTNQAKSLVNGLDLINVVDQLLLPLFRSEVDNKKKIGVPEVPAESIKYYFGSEFLKDNFNIPQYRTEEFIRFVERDEKFDFKLLNYGRELEFLELLNQKSIAFLNKSKNNKD